MPRVHGPIAAAFVLVLAAATTVGAQAPGGEEPTTGVVLYQRDCAWCHGPAGEGSPRGVPLLDAGAASAHFYLSTGRMPIAAPEHRIRRDDVEYTDAEIDALVRHVASLGVGPPIPDLEGVADADLARGGRLYREHCGQCHGSTGVGVALGFDVVAPSVLPSTPTQVAEAMIVGPGAMPAFTGPVLDEAQALAITRYVGELQEAPARGGYPFARSGRLDELLVAWVLGIGVLVLSVRWIARAR